ncbi:MAG: hypothetical protein HWE27_16350 [Gammaproteobacteria bacterium]|nr:hypothetical protein [Gammaproteobacteria bacterium]
MSATLRILGTIGVVLFGLLFLITFISPKVVEESTKGFVKLQIEKEVREKYKSASQSSTTDKALDIAAKLGLEKEKVQQDIDNKLPETIASVIASMCGYDCEKKKALTKSITASYLERIKNIEVAQDTLSNIIKGKYLEIVGSLKLDLRIFLGTNFMMFLLLLAMSFIKPQAIAHLFLPGILLFLATVIASSIYIFGQDWFYTILYNDYFGFGYLAYLSIIFGVLVDIAINKARITCEIINAISSAIGSAFSVVPC